MIDQKDLRYGIRSIELVQDKDSIGKSFYFKLNGKPIFIKGANYVPQDYFIPGVTNFKTERLLSDAVKSNINMLRVWGGGFYPDDEFYKLCDEKGILIWQDFMFANGMYPFHFLFDNISHEIDQLTSPFYNHCSLSLLCGNNEVEEGWYNWGWQKEFGYSLGDSLKIWNDYLEFYKWLGDSYFPYIPTSPKIGWGHPEAMEEGDSHYWGVWWGMEPFEMYEKKIPRFMSEYGFQGFPDMKTIDAFTLPEDRYLNSPVMKAHQKHPTGYETIQTYMEREYKQPKDFESYVYVSQLLQAYGIKRAIEAQRRAKPYCMGTMYWQLDDCWPGVTWSGIDYYGRWKAMQYFVKEAYKDILVSVHEENDSVKIYVVSDRLNEVKGSLEISLENMEGEYLPSPPIRSSTGGILYIDSVSIPANSISIWYSFSKKGLFGDQNNIVLFVKFRENITENEYTCIYYFVPPKDLALENPEVSYEIDSKTGELELSSKKLAKNVHIEINNPSAPLNLENNYFDLLPGEKVKIKTGIKNLDSSKIKISSLFDSY